MNVKNRVSIISENKFSMKIISHKVKKYLPNWFYIFLLKIRYYSFRKECSRSNMNETVGSYSDGSWVLRKTTSDLLRIENYLLKVSDGKSLLQIGIGNSSLYKRINHLVRHFDGVTIVEDEVHHAEILFPKSEFLNYQVHLINKYSNELKILPGSYDYIIDNDLSSYACCHKHFNDMLNNYAILLNDTGKVIVGINGLSYFDTGFGLTPSMLKKIAYSHGFVFSEFDDFYVLNKIK